MFNILNYSSRKPCSTQIKDLISTWKFICLKQNNENNTIFIRFVSVMFMRSWFNSSFSFLLVNFCGYFCTAPISGCIINGFGSHSFILTHIELHWPDSHSFLSEKFSLVLFVYFSSRARNMNGIQAFFYSLKFFNSPTRCNRLAIYTQRKWNSFLFSYISAIHPIEK